MGKKILVVDDERDSLQAITQRLEAMGYSVVGTSDARAVFEIADKEAPDLIILDIIMPDMNGYEVCERLKSDEKTSGIPIILLTGERLEPKSILDRCLNLGVESFLLKPLKLEDLISKIKETLGEK